MCKPFRLRKLLNTGGCPPTLCSVAWIASSRGCPGGFRTNSYYSMTLSAIGRKKSIKTPHKRREPRPLKPHTSRYQHYAEPLTTSTFAGQLRRRRTELRHCCFPFRIGRNCTLEKERPVAEELHARIQRTLVSSVHQSAAVYRCARRKRSTHIVM